LLGKLWKVHCIGHGHDNLFYFFVEKFECALEFYGHVHCKNTFSLWLHLRAAVDALYGHYNKPQLTSSSKQLDTLLNIKWRLNVLIETFCESLFSWGEFQWGTIIMTGVNYFLLKQTWKHLNYSCTICKYSLWQLL